MRNRQQASLGNWFAENINEFILEYKESHVESNNGPKTGTATSEL